MAIAIDAPKMSQRDPALLRSIKHVIARAWREERMNQHGVAGPVSRAQVIRRQNHSIAIESPLKREGPGYGVDRVRLTATSPCVFQIYGDQRRLAL